MVSLCLKNIKICFMSDSYNKAVVIDLCYHDTILWSSQSLPAIHQVCHSFLCHKMRAETWPQEFLLCTLYEPFLAEKRKLFRVWWIRCVAVSFPFWLCWVFGAWSFLFLAWHILFYNLAIPLQKLTGKPRIWRQNITSKWTNKSCTFKIITFQRNNFVNRMVRRSVFASFSYPSIFFLVV